MLKGKVLIQNKYKPDQSMGAVAGMKVDVINRRGPFEMTKY